MHKNSQHVIDFLKKSFLDGRLMHSYLFFGGEKQEKLAIAKWFAGLVLDVDDSGRALIKNEEHANMIIIRPDGKNIKKEQIVFLKSEIGKKSIENKAKVYIIEDADKMSISATNSLLKFLEEPAVDVYIILIAPSKEILLPTIISRCVCLAFRGFIRDSAIEAVFLDVIDSLENNEAGQIVMARHADLFKERLDDFLVAYQCYLYGKMERVFEDFGELEKCVRKLRALEEARQRLRYNVNASLCLDQLWGEICNF